ncbi:unnamed protein product [Caenorhabditis sp. 36 PRJEB53466]|nr:unnamed protein product [Caenorhabditis sp. 36 PRJEB53466]
MWPSECDLEPLDSIIERMNPIPGFPYPMKSAKNEAFPRNVGDPWIGAYTKNGYWFKLEWAGEEEWKEIANEMWYRNEFLVDSKSFVLYGEAMGKDNLKLLVAKNIRGEVLGLALLARHPSAQFSIIGALFVQEDFRHVGIGSILTREVKKTEKGVAFNAILYLLPTVVRMHLEARTMRTFGRIRVQNPSGFTALKESKNGIVLKFGSEIELDEDWEKVIEFGESCTNEKRNWKAFLEDEEGRTQLVAAFDENAASCVVGISVLREIHNEDGHIPDLLVAPLYAKSSKIAEALLAKTLKKHYNPEDDYDFDVDHLAIYRRSVQLFVFAASESAVFPLLRKLAGIDGSMEKDRLTYQTCSDFQLPAISHDMIFAISDPNIYTCENGEISEIACKKGWFGTVSCENKTMTCEQKLFCCTPSLTTRKGASTLKSTSTRSTTSTVSWQNECEKCDLAARHSCFISLHFPGNLTTESPNPDCLACENCCDDAFPHKCEVWKNHDFCDLEWYSKDKRQILCGKTCGICQ